MLVRSLQSICSMSAHRNESIVTSFEPDCNVRMNPFFFWLTSYCKSMSTKIIINTHTHFATKHMLDFVVFLVTWPYFFHQIASIVHFKGAHIFSPIARHERERKATRKPKSTESDSQISYRKMCFQFSPSFTLDACFLVWQTSSQSNIILFAQSVLDAVGWRNTVDAGVEAPFSNITKNVGSNETERHGEN